VNYAKVKQGITASIGLALTLLFMGMTVCAAPREYAVQIAAVRSSQIADDMRHGLSVQGLEAYWVKANLPEHGSFYRVRLGKFPSIETAYTYAEVLLNSGLLESYAITAYEAPMSGPLRDMMQASMEVQEYVQQGPSPRETSELFAAIGARQWLFPSSRNLFAGKPQLAAQVVSQAPGLNRREMLVFALSSHEWRMTPDPSIFFVRAPVIASNTDLAVNPASPKFDAAPVIQSVANPPVTSSLRPVNPSPSSNSFNNNNSGAAAPRNIAEDIGRKSKPTTPRGIGYGKIPVARLQATAELRNGQLVMRLRNLDEELSFTGTARVTLSDDRNSNEIKPIPFNLSPNQEMILPINDPVAMGSSWMLMVFDEGNAMRLLRGASFGQKPGSPMAQGQNNSSAQTVSAPPSDQFTLNAPSYVTGVFDATGSQSSGMVPVNNAPASLTTGSGKAGTDALAASQSPTPATPADAPGQLTITPRQIAMTTENVTLEFDIASPQPLNYISVMLAAGDYRDVRQALMSTTRGRVPFLIPAGQAAGTFIYEIKDEGGRVLGGGVGDFRQLAGK